MFIDRVKIKLIAGNGGNGVVAWRREKYVPKGGPYGGNGGRGGDLILEADESLFSLEPFRFKRLLKGENGGAGGSNLKQGRTGGNHVIKVPFGTLVKDANTQEILFDFTLETPKWTACLGGKGGKGNAFYKTSTHQAPNICTPGKDGEEKELELELKLIADVGLVGMPNAGKSTLMSKITHAKVKIGAYPFTTLTPNLSYVECEDYHRILVADIPGILENAHQNKGLGLEFLRHIERTNTLIFVIDIAPDEQERDAFSDFEILRKELGAYNSEMLSKPFVVALNKMDKEGAAEAYKDFQKKYSFAPETLIPISATNEEGLSDLIHTVRQLSCSDSPHNEYHPA